MSERTPCNYCNLKRIKEKEKGKKIELKEDKYGWLAVYVDGEKYGIYFQAITDYCVC